MYFGFPLSVDNLLLVDSPGVSSSVPSPRNSLRPFSPDQKFGKTATPLVNHAPRVVSFLNAHSIGRERW